VMLTPLLRLTMTPRGVTATTGYAVPLTPAMGQSTSANQLHECHLSKFQPFQATPVCSSSSGPEQLLQIAL
jgi:hypothetical protein